MMRNGHTANHLLTCSGACGMSPSDIMPQDQVGTQVLKLQGGYPPSPFHC